MPDPTSANCDSVSPKEFAARSGLSLSTVRRYLADGRLPSVQHGGRRCRVLIPLSILTQFSRKTTAECERQPVLPKHAPALAPPTSLTAKSLPGPAPRWLAKS
jgi:excisionase family DNA binding protein